MTDHTLALEARIKQLEEALDDLQGEVRFDMRRYPDWLVDCHVEQSLERAEQALSAPHPEPSAAMAVVNAACGLVDWPWFENVSEEEQALKQAVEAYQKATRDA